MGRNKKYTGYRAFQYLEPGVDYREFKLREEMLPDMTEWVPLTEAEEEHFESIMEKSVVISLHDHPSRRPEVIAEREDYSREGRESLAYESLAKSGLDCVLDNMMDGSNFVNTKHGWDWMSTIHDLGMKLCDISKQDFVIHAKSVADIQYAHETGRLAWVASVESCSCIENEVDRLDVLYGLGVRCMGVNYSESNMLGSGLEGAPRRRSHGLRVRLPRPHEQARDAHRHRPREPSDSHRRDQPQQGARDHQSQRLPHPDPDDPHVPR